MQKLTEFAPAETPVNDTLTLPFEQRQKSRFSAITDTGKAVGLFLPRGHYLRSGVLLRGDNLTVRINAAPELLSVLRCDEPLLFARACYHLGNRHVALQILPNELRYLHDHVLDNMLEGLGLVVQQDTLPFEPEAGAYHSHD